MLHIEHTDELNSSQQQQKTQTELTVAEEEGTAVHAGGMADMQQYSSSLKAQEAAAVLLELSEAVMECLCSPTQVR